MVVRDKAQQGEAKSGHTCSTQDREFSGELNDRSANANWSFNPFLYLCIWGKAYLATVDGQTSLQVVSLLGAQSSTGHLYLCICNFCICVFISISICGVKQDLAIAHLVYKLIACWNLIWTFLEFKLWATCRSSSLEKTRYGHWTQNKATMSKKKHRPFVRNIKVVLCVSGDQEYISTSLRLMSAR